MTRNNIRGIALCYTYLELSKRVEDERHRKTVKIALGE